MVQRAAAAGGRAGRPPVPPLGPRVPTPAGHKLPPRQPSGRAPSKTRLDGSPQLESRPHPQITCAPDPARATVARGGPAGRHVPRQPGGVHPTLAQDLGGRWELGAGCGSHKGRSGAGPRSDCQLSAFRELDSWVLRKTGRQGAEGLDATQGKRAHPDHCPAWLPQEGAWLLISQEGGSKRGRRPRASLGLPWRTSHRH